MDEDRITPVFHVVGLKLCSQFLGDIYKTMLQVFSVTKNLGSKMTA